MSQPVGYSPLSYGEMITDRRRMTAYVQALRQAVRPGSIVLDIGAGTGIFSLVACQLGAAHVHAVEPNDAIEVARATAVANGWTDRITFHQALSSAVTLPRRADVIISDLRGVLPLLQHHIPAIADARRRLLAPGGVLIPRRDTLWAALIEDPKLYRPYVEPWLGNDYGLDLRAGQRLVVNNWRKVNARPERLMSAPQPVATLDYATIEQPDVAGGLSWTADRPGTAHGLLVWFDAELADGVGFCNAPGQPELIYGQAFFPFEGAVGLEKGDVIAVDLRADLVEGDYVWRWNTRVLHQGQPGRVKANFRQSTFYGGPIVLAALKQREAGFVPPRRETAEVDQVALSLMNGATSLGEIAAALMERFPRRFPRQQDGLTHAADLAKRYDL